MVESLGDRKQQEKIPVLLGLRRKYAVLQDKVKIPYAWIEYNYHVGHPIFCNSIVQSGLIAGGKLGKEDDKLYSSQQWIL